MPSHTLHVVQAFEQRDGGIVPVELGDWDSARTGIIPDGGKRRASAISPCPSARVAVRAKRQAAPPKCSPCR